MSDTVAGIGNQQSAKSGGEAKGGIAGAGAGSRADATGSGQDADIAVGVGVAGAGSGAAGGIGLGIAQGGDASDNSYVGSITINA